MNSKSRTAFFTVALLPLAVVTHFAGAAEASEGLGSGLLPWGAEKAGNADGTIPAYTGKITVPANYDPKNPGVRPDPFNDEKKLYTVDAKNMAQYDKVLSEGLKAMLQKYPTFRLDVYPSHRTVVYPKWVQDNSLKNASACKVINNGLTIEGCFSGVPFPTPKDGTQVMWNHTVKYSAAGSREARMQSWVVDSSGGSTLQGDQLATYNAPFYDETLTGPVPVGTDYYQYRQDGYGPARKAGEKLLILNSTDMTMTNGGTRTWQYLAGQRRVKLAPDLSYDTPQPQGGGAMTMDDVLLFLGPLDRFDWKLLGKREMLIPYNTYKQQAGGSCSTKQLLTPNHLNPDCVRWELHRVWAVEGTRKAGARHIYAKRIFYFDEDSLATGIAENYDASGKPYRVSLAFPYSMYETEGTMTENSMTADLVTGTYAVTAIASESGGWYAIPRKRSNFFTSDALGASGIR